METNTLYTHFVVAVLRVYDKLHGYDLEGFRVTVRGPKIYSKLRVTEL